MNEPSFCGLSEEQCEEFRRTPGSFNDMVRKIHLSGRDAGLSLAAQSIIEATRIPDDAIARGTGVRDHVVIMGERLAEGILRLHSDALKCKSEPKGIKQWPLPKDVCRDAF